MFCRRGLFPPLAEASGLADCWIDSEVPGDDNAWYHVIVPSLPDPTWFLDSAFAYYRLPTWDFYESQLAILVFFSIFFYALDKKFLRKSNPRESSDHLEDGRPGHLDNVSILARKYLTVYAIVMGGTSFINNVTYLITVPRRGLAPGSVCVLPLRRGICVPRTNGCLAFRDRLHVRCPYSSVSWGLG